MSIRAVIFDFGGVLVRMVDDRPRLELSAQLGVPLSELAYLVFSSESAQKASRGEIPVSLHWQAVGQALSISTEKMPAFLDKYWSADDLNWELVEYIRSLKPCYKVGLLSNAWDDLRQTIHTRWNIDGLFDAIVVSAEVKMIKPDPHIFHLAVERLQVQPGEAAFVDDVAENVEAAREEGLAAIQYQDIQQTIGELNRIISSAC
jgi:epoxide hydrolase-like predicted phosphatase